MTELELVLNDQTSINSQWGFGQVYRRFYIIKITCAKLFHDWVLLLVLTIAPLLSLYENFLAHFSVGSCEESIQTIRFPIRGASGLQRRTGRTSRRLHRPALAGNKRSHQGHPPPPFAVIAIAERDIYVTYGQQDTHDLNWEESFDVEVGDLSTVVVRIFDLKCMDAGRPSLIGILPSFCSLCSRLLARRLWCLWRRQMMRMRRRQFMTFSLLGMEWRCTSLQCHHVV